MADETTTTEPTVAERVETRLTEIDESVSTRIGESAAALRAENKELSTRLEKAEEKIRMINRGPDPADAKPEPIMITKLCRGIVRERFGRDGSDPWADAGYEREIVKQCASTRADTMVIGQDTLGGYFVDSQYLPQLFIELLRSKTVLAELGITTMSGLVGSPVQIPRQSGASSAFYTGEITAPAESNPTAALATLTPKALRGLVTVSKLSIMLANPSMDAFVQNDMAMVMARRRELGVLQGTDSDYEPLGLINTSGIQSSTINAVPSDLDDFEAMVYQVEAENADNGRLAWLMNPREWHTLRLMKDGTGRYLLQRGQDGSVPKMLHGYPVVTSTAVPITLGATSDRGRVIFGDWTQLVDAEWSGMTFDLNDKADSYWSLGIVGIMVGLFHDAMVRQEKGFVVDNTVDSA